MVDTMSFSYCLLIRFSSINTENFLLQLFWLIKAIKYSFPILLQVEKNVYAIAFIIQYAYRSFSHQWTDEQADK